MTPACAEDPLEWDYSDEDEACPCCGDFGGDPMNDYCLPCPLCGEG
jgi:hypothetical protein